MLLISIYPWEIKKEDYLYEVVRKPKQKPWTIVLERYLLEFVNMLEYAIQVTHPIQL